MKSGSEGAALWHTNELVWVQKQKQGIQYVHPNEKVFGRRQSWITGDMKGLVGVGGKRRQGKMSEK